MTLEEFNALTDEVTASREIAYAILEAAEEKRKRTITQAREFIKKRLGEDALVSISAALCQIEQQSDAPGHAP